MISRLLSLRSPRERASLRVTFLTSSTSTPDTIMCLVALTFLDQSYALPPISTMPSSVSFTSPETFMALLFCGFIIILWAGDLKVFVKRFVVVVVVVVLLVLMLFATSLLKLFILLLLLLFLLLLRLLCITMVFLRWLCPVFLGDNMSLE